MSRSLRTRPQTLYQQQGPQADDHGRIISRDGAEQMHDNGPSALPQSALRDQPTDHGAKGNRSKVSSNLKKRLSMRYKDGADPMQDHIYRMAAASEIPEMPPVPMQMLAPATSSRAQGPGTQQDAMSAALSIPGFSLGQNHQMLPVMQEDVALAEEAAIFRAEEQQQEVGSSNRAYAAARSEPSSMSQRFAMGIEFARKQSSSSAGGSAAGADLAFIGSERFDPQAYLRALSADAHDASADSLERARENLLSLKKLAQVDLQRQVFANYTDFISTSKEVASLENDMLELKELLREWTSLPTSLDSSEWSIQQASGIGTATALTSGLGALSALSVSRLSSRNSIQDLSQVYKAQIQAIWDNIEGSQKYVTNSAGRHIVAEAPNFVELNNATYRPKQPVSLFLLDDLLLVASRKRKQMSAKIHLIADRCFNLGEIVVIDLKDASDLSNAIKIKRGKEVYVYRTDKIEEKKSLLSSFRRVAEDLAVKRKQAQQATSDSRKRESLLNLSGSAESPGEVEGLPEKQLSDWSDELVVAIALREWDEAVTLVEKGRETQNGYVKADPLYLQIQSKLQQHTASLVSAVSNALVSPTIKKAGVVKYVSLLLRLDQGELARDIFLRSRSDVLRRRCRQIRFEGDICLYISELALVHFTLIRNTSEWYMSAFKDNRMSSGFVKWVALEMENYADTFRKQVYNAEQHSANDSKTISDAIDISRRSAAHLKEVGLNFEFLIEALLRPEAGKP